MPSEKEERRNRIRQRLMLKSPLAREILSEFLGTCILIVLGCGSVAQSVLSRGTFGGALSINVGFAVAVGMAVYVSGGVSGGHINPAVSFALCLFGRMKWSKFPFYVGAQFLGAFVGSAILFGVYYDAFMSFADGELYIVGENATAQIFATYPAPYLSLANGFADQVVSTMFLLMVIFAIFDSRNWSVPKGLEPVVIALLVLVLVCCLELNCGCAMNPARDLSPRLFTALAGWGFDVFRAGNYFWWIPVVGPMVGAAIGGLIYVLFIEIHHPNPYVEAEQPRTN